MLKYCADEVHLCGRLEEFWYLFNAEEGAGWRRWDVGVEAADAGYYGGWNEDDC